MESLLCLGELPEVGDDQENKKLVALAEEGPLPGESVCHWCVMDSGPASSDCVPQPLPEWFKIPIDRTVSIWKKEKDEWDKKKQLRFEAKNTYELTKAAEEKYKDNRLNTKN